jgi:hypothetical protein
VATSKQPHRAGLHLQLRLLSHTLRSRCSPPRRGVINSGRVARREHTASQSAGHCANRCNYNVRDTTVQHKSLLQSDMMQRKRCMNRLLDRGVTASRSRIYSQQSTVERNRANCTKGHLLFRRLLEMDCWLPVGAQERKCNCCMD